MENIPELRVQAGIDLLNKHFGDNSWAKKINLVTFNIDDPENCILAQLFGTFEFGLMILGLKKWFREERILQNSEDAQFFGFWPEQCDEDFVNQLNTYWEKYITLSC